MRERNFFAMQTPEVKKRRGISPIWILPVIALLIGGWLLFKGVRDAPVRIVVHFDNAEGVTAGKTRVMYRGIPSRAALPSKRLP